MGPDMAQNQLQSPSKKRAPDLAFTNECSREICFGIRGVWWILQGVCRGGACKMSLSITQQSTPNSSTLLHPTPLEPECHGSERRQGPYSSENHKTAVLEDSEALKTGVPCSLRHCGQVSARRLSPYLGCGSTRVEQHLLVSVL